jgi:predicted nucleotidyltransferase
LRTGKGPAAVLPDVHDLLGNYLALNEELEQILGRKVDRVMSDAA